MMMFLVLITRETDSISLRNPLHELSGVSAEAVKLKVTWNTASRQLNSAGFLWTDIGGALSLNHDGSQRWILSDPTVREIRELI